MNIKHGKQTKIQTDVLFGVIYGVWSLGVHEASNYGIMASDVVKVLIRT